MQQGPFWWKVKPMLNVFDLTGEENGLIFSLLGVLIKLPHQYHLQIRFHLAAGLGHTQDENLCLFCLWGKKLPSSKLDKGKGVNLICVEFSYVVGDVLPNAVMKKNDC